MLFKQHSFICLCVCVLLYACKTEEPEKKFLKPPNKLHKVSEKKRVKNPKPVIVIDAGHGGGDPGGRNDTTGMFEKNFTLPIANAIIARLDTNIFKVVATRTTDIEIDRHIRTARVEPLNPDLFISIHCNWAADTLRNGFELYYGDSLIDYVQNRDTVNFANPHKPVLLKYCDILRRNTEKYIKYMPYRFTRPHEDRIWVLYGVTFPSLLIEFGYVTGREDFYVLTDLNQVNLFASVVAKSVHEMFKDFKRE
jgi:N-acetylmuramoyl-L-alanine amidase